MDDEERTGHVEEPIALEDPAKKTPSRAFSLQSVLTILYCIAAVPLSCVTTMGVMAYDGGRLPRVADDIFVLSFATLGLVMFLAGVVSWVVWITIGRSRLAKYLLLLPGVNVLLCVLAQPFTSSYFRLW